MNTIPWPLMLPALVFTTAPAIESWGIPDFHEADKVEHFEGGVIIGALGTAVAQRELPKAKWWQQALVGVAASAVIGVAKEVADTRTHGDPDPKDAIATVIGGTVGALSISVVVHF